MMFSHGITHTVWVAIIFYLVNSEVPSSKSRILVSAEGPRVDIPQGTLEGKLELSRNGRNYLSFKGIPYGKIPQRFNIAEPADGWLGVREAKEFGPICPQIRATTGQLEGHEQCLSLNVYVPEVERLNETSLPVLFYVYGGSFTSGETNMYGPRYFMDEDVILVTANYRVGPFGFLNAGIKGASGNQGLKDLVLALKWVQNNIAAFHGNASQVTIFGYSAGGAAIGHLVTSPMTKGLFSGAIAQSGISAIGWQQLPDPEFDEPKKLAVALDCPTSNREYMVECLRKVSTELLVLASTPRDPVGFDRASTFAAAPAIETYKESENDPNVFQSENVEEIWENGTFNRVPLVIGFTSSEGITIQAVPILVSEYETKELNEKWGRVMPQTMFYWYTAGDPCVVSSKLRNAYFQDRPANKENVNDLVDMFSDSIFQYAAKKAAQKASRFTPVYIYNFTRQVTSSLADIYGWYPITNMTILKPPAHADDVQFLFNGAFFYPEIGVESPDYEFSVNSVKFITSFARDGKPTHVWGSDMDAGSIQPVDPDQKLQWIQIDNEMTLLAETDRFTERMRVHDDICKNDIALCLPLI